MIKFKYDVFENKSDGIYQIRSKSDIITIQFTQEEEKVIFLSIVDILKNKNISDFQQLISELIDGNNNKDNVINVIDKLKKFNVFQNQDTFENLEQFKFIDKYSSFSNDFAKKIATSEIVIIGRGLLVELLETKAKKTGYKNVIKILLEESYNIDEIFKACKSSDLIIVDSDSWDPIFLENFNKFALDNKKPWIIVRGNESTRGTVGPIFIPGITGCYNCLITRVKSTMSYLSHFEEYENFLRLNKTSSAIDGGLAVSYDILASIAILESVKYLTDFSIPSIFKAFLSININDYQIKSNPFLKIPHCPVCNPKMDFNPAPWLETATLKNTKDE
ncbi:MAG: TOMM precursor leader peptide-binding protein [Bacteroidales bacterium]|nr:TOMM precursor leader peptide-binding protein [Bacteroidales bacterium]